MPEAEIAVAIAVSALVLVYLAIGGFLQWWDHRDREIYGGGYCSVGWGYRIVIGIFWPVYILFLATIAALWIGDRIADRLRQQRRKR